MDWATGRAKVEDIHLGNIHSRTWEKMRHVKGITNSSALLEYRGGVRSRETSKVTESQEIAQRSLCWSRKDMVSYECLGMTEWEELTGVVT